MKIDLLQISKKKPNCLILFFFAKQYSIINNNSEILSFLHPKTDKSLSKIMFTEKDIKKVIQNLDSNEAHGNGMTSIRMLKICIKSIIKPLLIIYKKYLENCVFPTSGRKQILYLSIKK